MSLIRNFTNPIASALVSILTALMVVACGGGSSDSESQPTGRLSFQLQWDRTSSSRTGLERAGTDDCSDVVTVTAAAYDTSGGLLQTGGPWDCTDGQGILTRVPANREVRVAIAGFDAYGTALYRGESGAFYLPGGGSVDAGLITAGTFTATLTSPGDGDIVPITNVTLAWNAVSGADHYVVQVADSYFFDAASIRETLTVDASAAPSCEPDTSYMNVEGSYYWRVQVVDGAGNTSDFSMYRYFFISQEVLTVNITSPAVATVQLGDMVTFTAGVTDPDGNPLTESDLNYISWSSDVNGTLTTTQLSFSTDTLAGAYHSIYLYVSQPSGYYGSAQFNLRVNNPPTATIVFPTAAYQHYNLNNLSCQGLGDDAEDGNITSTLQWQLFDPSGALIDTGVGGSPTFPFSNFNLIDQYYTITIQLTDQHGGTGTDSVSFLNTGG